MTEACYNGTCRAGRGGDFVSEKDTTGGFGGGEDEQADVL